MMRSDGRRRYDGDWPGEAPIPPSAPHWPVYMTPPESEPYRLRIDPDMRLDGTRVSLTVRPKLGASLVISNDYLRDIKTADADHEVEAAVEHITRRVRQEVTHRLGLDAEALTALRRKLWQAAMAWPNPERAAIIEFISKHVGPDNGE